MRRLQLTNSPNRQLTSGALVDRERGPAAAGRRRVRILDRKAAARDGVDEVDLCAIQIADADRIDEQLYAVRLEHLVARPLAVFLDHQAVLETRAAAALHEHAKAAARLVFFGEQLVDLRSRRF